MPDKFLVLQYDAIEMGWPNSFDVRFGDRVVRLPKSQIADPDALYVADGPGEIEVAEWLVIKEELEGFEVEE